MLVWLMICSFCSIHILGSNYSWMNHYLYTDMNNFIFLLVLLSVSTGIFFFSNFYLQSEQDLKLFKFWLVFFILSMSLLLTSKDLLSLFLGWEGLGISSFYLIFFYSSWNTASSAVKTVMINKFGDILFVLLICLGLNFFNSTMMALCMVVTLAFTKSAIFPFSFWLPNAMTAPTPISALVHSSTLVTAGLWMIFLNPELEFWSELIFFGMTTSLVGGLMALTEMDFKKLVAYSTLSQLGFILTSMTAAGFTWGFIHLLSHALFKSLMFCCVGMMIITSSHNQSEKWLQLPQSLILKVTLTFSTLGLMAFPFFLGFLSKHLILASQNITGIGFLFSMMFCLSLILTILYSGRILMVFYKQNIMEKSNPMPVMFCCLLSFSFWFSSLLSLLSQFTNTTFSSFSYFLLLTLVVIFTFKVFMNKILLTQFISQSVFVSFVNFSYSKVISNFDLVLLSTMLMTKLNILVFPILVTLSFSLL